jgi:hypothetical protein
VSEGRRGDGTFGAGNRANREGLNVSPLQRTMRAKIKACAPDAIDFLLSVVRGEIEDAKPSDRIRAAEVIVNKTIANPKQRVAVSGQLRNPVGELSTEEIQALIRAAKGGESK